MINTHIQEAKQTLTSRANYYDMLVDIVNNSSQEEIAEHWRATMPAVSTLCGHSDPSLQKMSSLYVNLAKKTLQMFKDINDSLVINPDVDYKGVSAFTNEDDLSPHFFIAPEETMRRVFLSSPEMANEMTIAGVCFKLKCLVESFKAERSYNERLFHAQRMKALKTIKEQEKKGKNALRYKQFRKDTDNWLQETHDVFFIIDPIQDVVDTLEHVLKDHIDVYYKYFMQHMHYTQSDPITHATKVQYVPTKLLRSLKQDKEVCHQRLAYLLQQKNIGQAEKSSAIQRYRKIVETYDPLTRFADKTPMLDIQSELFVPHLMGAWTMDIMLHRLWADMYEFHTSPDLKPKSPPATRTSNPDDTKLQGSENFSAKHQGEHTEPATRNHRPQVQKDDNDTADNSTPLSEATEPRPDVKNELTVEHSDDINECDAELSKLRLTWLKDQQTKKDRSSCTDKKNRLTSDAEPANETVTKIQDLAKALAKERTNFKALFESTNLKKRFKKAQIERWIKMAGGKIMQAEGSRVRILFSKEVLSDLMIAEVPTNSGQVSSTLHSAHGKRALAQKFLSVTSVKQYRALLSKAGITPQNLWPEDYQNSKTIADSAPKARKRQRC